MVQRMGLRVLYADPQLQKLNDICDLLLSMIQTHNMTRQMMNAMLTGNWVTHASIAQSMHCQNNNRTGVVQYIQFDWQHYTLKAYQHAT
jgi:hypothetical protein